MIDLCKNCGNHNLAQHAPILNPSKIWFECYKNVKLVEKESSITGRINYEKSGEPYQEYIERISKNPLKIEDLKDNMDTKRLYKLTDTDKTRIEKYKKALNFLTGEL